MARWNGPRGEGTGEELEALTFADAAEWEAWLAAHHDRGGAWLKIAKKGSGERSVTISEALDVALCYGWIDSHRKGLDERWYLQKYTPRRPTSSWSKVNTDRVAALAAAGRMREPGLAQVAAAKADGRWDAAYEPQRSAAVPPDLEAALAHNADAQRAFNALGKSDRYALILRLLKARTADARAARLAEVITVLEVRERRR
jgi:uncharacterized protein YdeI (YjbR/CyaY-like superfamily)